MGNPLEVAEGLDIVYTTAFPLGEGEERLYREMLAYALELDSEGFRRALEKGGRRLLERFNPEEYVFGIFLFYKDLITGQGGSAPSAQRGSQDLPHGLPPLGREVRPERHLRLGPQAPRVPGVPGGLPGGLLGGHLQNATPPGSGGLQGLAGPRGPEDRRLPDREGNDLDGGGRERRGKSERVASLYARYQVEIGQELLRLGLPLEEPAPSV